MFCSRGSRPRYFYRPCRSILYRSASDWTRKPNASALEIFDLRSGATKEQIQERYLELAKMHHPDSVGAMSSSTEIGNNWQRVVNAKNELQRAVALPIKRAQKRSHLTGTKIATPLARKQSMRSVHPPNQAMFARTTLQSQEPLPHNTEDFPINNSQSTSPSGKPTPDKPIQPPTDFRPKPPRPSKWPGLTRLKETRNTTIKAQHTNLAFTTAPNTFIRDGPWKYTGGKRIELNSVENLNIAAAPIWVHLWNVAAIQLFKMHGSLYYNPPSRIVFSESFPYRLLHFKQQITVAVESGRAVSPLSHIWTSRFQKGFDYRIIRDRPNSTVVFYPFRWKDLARTIVYGFIPFSLLGIIGITWKIFRLIFTLRGIVFTVAVLTGAKGIKYVVPTASWIPTWI